MDAFGGMIEATMFNQDVEKYMPNIKEQSVYQISNAHVKVAN